MFLITNEVCGGLGMDFGVGTADNFRKRIESDCATGFGFVGVRKMR